jgi:uncharacterized protein HemX
MDSAVWVGIGAVATAVIGALVAGVVKLSTSKFEREQQARTQTVGEYKDVISALQDAQRGTQAELARVRTDLQAEVERGRQCEQRAARLEAWQGYVEGVLRDAGIHFAPFPPGPGSGTSLGRPTSPG